MQSFPWRHCVGSHLTQADDVPVAAHASFAGHVDEAFPAESSTVWKSAEHVAPLGPQAAAALSTAKPAVTVAITDRKKDMWGPSPQSQYQKNQLRAPQYMP